MAKLTKEMIENLIREQLDLNEARGLDDDMLDDVIDGIQNLNLPNINSILIDNAELIKTIKDNKLLRPAARRAIKDDDLKYIRVNFAGNPPPPPPAPPANTSDFDKFTQRDLTQDPSVSATRSIKKFDFTLSRIPAKIKSLILRLFKSEIESIDKDIDTDDEVLKALASIKENSLNEDAAKLEWEDFAKILANPDNQLYDNAVRTIVQASNIEAIKNTEAGKALTALGTKLNLTPAASSAPTPVEDPSVPTIDIADAHGEDRSKTPAYVIDLFNNLNLGATTNVEQRINILNNATDKIMQDKSDFQNIGDAVSTVAVAGLMANIAKRMDDKSAGWAFESFLAQLVNGKTIGTGMGAADFFWGIGGFGVPDGSKGSAKLISASPEFSQSRSTLNTALQNKDDKMYYIVGFKGDEKYDPTKSVATGGKQTPTGGTAGVKVGTASPAEVAKIGLYVVEVRRDKVSTDFPASDFQYGEVGASNTQAKDSGTNAKFSIQGQTAKGVIYLNKSLETVKEKSAEALRKVNADLPKLFQGIEKFRRNTNSYLSSGRIDAGEKAADGYAELFALVNSVFGVKGEQETGRKVSVGQASDAKKGVERTTTTDVTENKMEQLDLMIENMVKQFIKGNLND